MGNRCTKSSNSSRSSILDNIALHNMPSSTSLDIHDSGVRVESIAKEDEHTVRVIKKELREMCQKFVVNNMIMSMQFFGNHQETIQQLQHSSASPKEKELNKTLLKYETMNITYPDAIFEKVRENVLYRNFKEDSESESLVPKRIYVMNDLVEVVNSNEVPQYTVIDKPSYQVKMEESSRKGFVKLQQVEVTTTPKINNHEWATEYEPLPGPSTRLDEEYGYNTITELRTPKPIEIEKGVERRDTLPQTCFSQRKVRKIPEEYFDDDENESEILQHLGVEDLFKEITYINSQGFMKYFSSISFPGSLGAKLGFDEKDIQWAKTIPGKIFCDKYDEQTQIFNTYEVIPCIAIQWPSELTLPYMEFHEREERPTFFTRQGIPYRWPTKNMITEIMSMNCAVVPVGYHKKKGQHKDSDLEWEIHFPKAERYLEARMSHAQMKCYLVLLALHKTYISEHTHHQGLLIEHIRMHMFWECESDYRNWPEHRLGTKILMVIKNLAKKLMRCQLQHYFIKQKNVFENIPKKYLNFAQKIFLNILESPALYIMKALRNIRYTKGKFYPPINYHELYDDLTSNKGLTLLNPKILNVSRPPNFKKRVYNDPDIQVKHVLEIQKRKEIWRQKKEEELAKQIAQQNELEKVAADNDWILLDFPIENTFNMYKTKAILDIFIKNFIEIARFSANISTKEQTKFYLKQALYLTYILEDISLNFFDEAEDYRKSIREEENNLKKRMILRHGSQKLEEKPNVPLRNNIGPIPNRPLSSQNSSYVSPTRQADQNFQYKNDSQLSPKNNFSNGITPALKKELVVPRIKKVAFA